MIGMGDLHFVAEMLDLAADDADLALGQHLVQVIRPGVEEHENQRPRIVGTPHLVRQTRIRRRVVFVDTHRQGGDGAGGRRVHLRREAAVDQPDRQMPAQIGHMGSGERLDRLADARTDTRKFGDRREKGVKDLRTHGGSGTDGG